ncbi:hypothetical protein COW77_02620, partial [Candidatus Wolfebacteria bacterium CG18_big_fil_WC_8_21_14_2_50_39_7]|uniref:Uncharacterized protein n=5 Tax=Candidatus Wolfeibacteriota TaxID=1752735 RepID=A0A2M7Q650_9BACT
MPNKLESLPKTMEMRNDTVVEVRFPDKISIELVQANELRHYEIFTWCASLLATITVGFWTAYFTTNPKSTQLLWTAIAASVLFAVSLSVAIYYRRKVYCGSLIKTLKLSEFKSEK